MLEKVVKLPEIAKDSIDLRTPTGDNEDSHLGDFIDDEFGATTQRRDPDHASPRLEVHGLSALIHILSPV